MALSPLVAAGGALLACGETTTNTAGDAGSCVATRSDVEGPFYTADAPVRMALAEPTEAGTRIQISGAILDARDCTTPRAGYIVDAWQADDSGTYDNSGFRLRGKIQTGPTGEFVIDTVMPGRYPDRPFQHIHIKIRDADDQEVLTTQIYFAGDPQLPADVDGPRVTLVDGSGRLNFIV